MQVYDKMQSDSPQNNSLNDALIRNYQTRKSWYGKDAYLNHSEIFKSEVMRAHVPPGVRILEIGFGDGLFLDWARASGFDITGIEINDNFVTLAKKRNHRVYFGNPVDIFKNKVDKFDLICFFDVLEHLEMDAIVDMLNSVSKLLERKGRVVARFPNGASPFGRVHQHSDATHVTTLSGSIMEDLAAITGLRVISIRNSARSYRYGTQRFPLLKRLAYLTRDVIQFAIGYIYFGQNIPMDPNITVILEKANLSD